MQSILDFFKPVRKDKRPREEDTDGQTMEESTVAELTPHHSSLETHDKPRKKYAKKSTATAKTPPISSDSEPLDQSPIVKKTPTKTQDTNSIVAPFKSPERPHELSEYEQKRQAKMAANAKFLEELGMSSAQLEVTRQLQREQRHKAVNTKKRLKPKRVPEEVQLVRRSRRLRGETAPESTQQRRENAVESDHSDEPDELAVEASFAESSVLQYSVTGDESVRKPPMSSSEDGTGRELMGFQLDPKAYFADRELKKAYSISFSTYQENGLVAAGGTNGRVAIFPFSSSYHQLEVAAAEVDTHAPLMAFKAHNGWISAVNLARCIRGKSNLLLTASNDASVKLWDLNHISTMLQTPKEIFTSTNLHHKGIFGLDVCGDSVLTCSKDATIALSKFCPDTGALLVSQRFEDHNGVVKCVRFSPSNSQLFASGGNDRELRVYDVRVAPNPLVLSIEGFHVRAINSVQFHPTDGNLLLSAGFDPNFYMFDVRKATSPVCSYLKPPHSKDDSKAIFHPIFVRNGQAVVAARGHDLSLYRTSDGSAVSCGYIDDAATCIAADPFHDRITIAQGGKLQLADAQWD